MSGDDIDNTVRNASLLDQFAKFQHWRRTMF